MRIPCAPDVLTPLARRLFQQAPGAGAPAVGSPGQGGAWRHGSAGTASAGARIAVHVALDPEQRVLALRWQAWACPHSIATLGWLSQHWVGRRLDDPPAGGPAGWAQALGVPVEKLGRLLLIEDAILACRIREPVIAGTAGALAGPT